MSSTESVDPELVEETKQQIRGLVNEIADLTQEDIPEAEFYDGFLNRVVTALAGNGGVVWDLSSGRLQIGYQINLAESGLTEENQLSHGKLLRKVVESGEPMLAAPQSGGGEEDEAFNPTGNLLVLGLLRADEEVVGIVEIFQRPGAAATTQRGYLRFLMQMCDLAGDYFTRRSLRRYGDRQTLWNQVEQFTRAAHRTLDPRLTAYAIANEGRRLIECDRVSVAVMRGSRCRVESVSGQDTFDKRANQIVMLQHLANAVVRQGDPVWYTGDTTDMPPQVEDAFQDYVDESHSKTVAVIPLRRELEITEDSTEEEREPEPIIGALVVEQIEDARPREGMSQRVDVVAHHGSAALANAVEHNSLFLMPVWRAIGKSKWVVGARTLPKTVSITAAVISVILGLCFIPADYTLEGKGVLQPEQRQVVFTYANGAIRGRMPFSEGEPIKKDDVLAVIDDPELTLQIQQYEQQLSESREQMLSLLRQLSTSQDPQENDKIQGQIAVLRQTIGQTELQLKILDKKEDFLTIRSPMDGEIETQDVRMKLRNRPLQIGQELFTVSNSSGEWELEISMPENRMGDIAKAYEALKAEGKEADGKESEFKVTYILASDPKTTYTDYITHIGEIVEVAGEEGSIVRIKVSIRDKTKLEELRPGTTVIAHVYCGRASIGYVWFHDAVNFVHKIIFRFF